MPGVLQRIKLTTADIDDLLMSSVVLMDGEVCLVKVNDVFSYMIVGDGNTEAKSLNIIPLNISNGSVFLGAANLSTIPGSPNEPVFYLATVVGTYSGFGGITIDEGEVAFLVYKHGGWNKELIVKIDDRLDENSKNPVQNKVITKALKDLKDYVDSKTIVDRDMSNVSENSLMNKTITNKFSEFDWYEGQQ